MAFLEDDNIYLDRENDTDGQENENEDALNADYDRVSGSGMMPDINDFLGSDYHDPAFGSEYSEGLGDVVGDPRISDDAIPGFEDGYDSSAGIDGEDQMEFGQQPEPEPEDIKLSFRTLMDGSYIKSEAFGKMFPYMILVIFCCILYIANRNVAEGLIGKEVALKREVRELRAESITIAAQLMSISKETEVARRVEDKQLGIHELKSPPLYFVIDKYVPVDSLKDAYKVKEREYNNDFNDFEDEYKRIY